MSDTTEATSEKSWVPKLHMSFESDGKAYQFYCFYARETGFGVRKHLVKRRSNGTVYASTFCCYKEGFCRTFKEGKRPRPDARTGCAAHIGVRLMDDGKFHVTEFEAEHNHELVEKAPEIDDQLESGNHLAKRNFGGKFTGDISGVWVSEQKIFNRPVNALAVADTAARAGPSRRNPQEPIEESNPALRQKLYKSEIIEREPAQEDPLGENARYKSLHYLRDIIFDLDPRNPENFHDFTAKADAALGFLSRLGLRRDILKYWEGKCRQTEYIVNQFKASNLVRTQVTLPELRDRVRRHTEVVNRTKDELAMSEAILRRQHEDITNSAVEAEGYTIKLKRLWNEITALLACRAKAQETHSEHTYANAHQRQRHQIQQQNLVAVETALARSAGELEVAQTEHQDIMDLMAQLHGVKVELAQLGRNLTHD